MASSALVRHAVRTLLGASAVAALCSGCPNAKEPVSNVLAACPATDTRVVTACYGCSPYDERISNSLSQSGLPRDVMESTKQCLDGEINVNFIGQDIAKAKIQACAAKARGVLDPTYSKTLASIVEAAQKDVATNKGAQDKWDACRDNVRKCGKSDCDAVSESSGAVKTVRTTEVFPCQNDNVHLGHFQYRITNVRAPGLSEFIPAHLVINYRNHPPAEVPIYKDTSFKTDGDADIYVRLDNHPTSLRVICAATEMTLTPDGSNRFQPSYAIVFHAVDTQTGTTKGTWKFSVE